MKKLRKLSALLMCSLLVSGYTFAANTNEQKESIESNTGTNETNSVYSVNEANESSTFGILESARNKRFSVYAGYTANLKNNNRDLEKNNDYNNVIEIGAALTKQFSNNFGYSAYLGSDIMFNSNNFWVGPKVGGNINYSILMLGSEMIVYTDARYARLYYRPYIGVGVGPLKVAAGYNIGIANNATFKEINSFTVGITVPLFWGN